MLSFHPHTLTLTSITLIFFVGNSQKTGKLHSKSHLGLSPPLAFFAWSNDVRKQERQTTK